MESIDLTNREQVVNRLSEYMSYAEIPFLARMELRDDLRLTHLVLTLDPLILLQKLNRISIPDTLKTKIYKSQYKNEAPSLYENDECEYIHILLRVKEVIS